MKLVHSCLLNAVKGIVLLNNDRRETLIEVLRAAYDKKNAFSAGNFHSFLPSGGMERIFI